MTSRHLLKCVLIITALPFSSISASAQSRGIDSQDLYKLHSIGEVHVSPDGNKIAYTVRSNDGPGRPYTRIWLTNIAGGQGTPVDAERSGDAVWSPDGKWLAFQGTVKEKSGLYVVASDGHAPVFLADMQSTNTPLPGTGADITWSPDSNRIAFVSAVSGPEEKQASGDPVVITRYLYRPDFSEGNSRFSDNRRLHIFVVDRNGGTPNALTSGNFYEHSIEWSPDGSEILFISNREPDQDQFFNYDIFALCVLDKSVRRLTSTENAEYEPHWSPDGKKIVYLGTKRGLTDLETTMEDTHVWTMNADGSNRRELGTSIDNRQLQANWSSDGRFVYTTVEERGEIHLYRLPAEGGTPQRVIGDRGTVGAYSESKAGLIYVFASPTDSGDFYVTRNGTEQRLTHLNDDLFKTRKIAPVESFRFLSNDNKYEVEAFLTQPLGFDPSKKYPMIVMIHGGPHGQQGPNLNYRAQVYADHGWATLMVNYRGSTGYGQKFTDAVFRDQNGDEAMDVLYGVSAALRRYTWIDRDRLGVEGVSYGGQLTAWLTTQTNQFKAAIPIAAIINLVSYNYMTYYNQYEQMEWGAFPHQGNLMELLWERSALKHVANVHTPTMIVHGENDNDVPIAEAEQWYIALKDVGNETIMVRYPREGHGLREPKHQVENVERSIAWYEKHFSTSTK